MLPHLAEKCLLADAVTGRVQVLSLLYCKVRWVSAMEKTNLCNRAGVHSSHIFPGSQPSPATVAHIAEVTVLSHTAPSEHRLSLNEVRDTWHRSTHTADVFHQFCLQTEAGVGLHLPHNKTQSWHLPLQQDGGGQTLLGCPGNSTLPLEQVFMNHRARTNASPHFASPVHFPLLSHQ